MNTVRSVIPAVLAALALVLVPTVAGADTATGAAETGAAESTAPAAEAAPQLSIEIDNGRTTADIGDRLDYAITVRNLGADDLTGLVISQTVPAGLTVDTADTAGDIAAGAVTWTIALPAAGEAVLHTTATVGATGPEALRLATVACATPDGSQAPLVCASHSDQLPAGAAAEAAGAAATGTAVASQGGSGGSGGSGGVNGYLVAAAGVLTAGVLTLWLVGRRRARRRVSPDR